MAVLPGPLLAAVHVEGHVPWEVPIFLLRVLLRGVRHAVVVPRANPRVRLAGAFPPPALAAIPVALAGRRIVAQALCFCKTGPLAELLSGVMIGAADLTAPTPTA